MKTKLLSASLAVALVAVCAPDAAAQSGIILNNVDDAGVGLNDTTPATPVAGNPGRTLGEQRRIAFHYAADIWGALLASPIPIRVNASFAPLQCDDEIVVLGQAGPTSHKRNFDNAPLPQIDYTVAQATALAGKDLANGGAHLQAWFSSAIDAADCQEEQGVRGWYYGLLGNSDNEEDQSNFLNVIMHEIGHGLGMIGRLDESVYDSIAWSNQNGQSVKDLAASDFGALFEAVTTPGDVVWTANLANSTGALLADNRQNLAVVAPEAAAYSFVQAAFGNPDITSFPAGEVVLMRDIPATEGGVGKSLGCEGEAGQQALADPEALAGNIALVDRGECEFGLKALNAQKHGAVAVIIANSVDDTSISAGPGEHGGGVTIPVLVVSQSSGQAMRSDVPVMVAGIQPDPDRFYGLDDDGRVRLYTPIDYQSGSSYSHVDTDMQPNALMEPAETGTLQAHVFIDVALDMFEDMGWPTNRDGTAHIGQCDTGVPMVRNGSFIPGANLVAQQGLCSTTADGNRSKYMACMNDHAMQLRDLGILTNPEVVQVRSCVAKMR